MEVQVAKRRRNPWNEFSLQAPLLLLAKSNVHHHHPEFG